MALVGVVACGGKFPANGDAGDVATPPPAMCSWSSSFEPLDAAPAQDSCRAARRFLNCTGSDGTAASCLTDHATCDFSARPGVTYDCTDMCKATEFAATCGTIMGSTVVPPADCPKKVPSPGGILYCCTCS